MPKKQHWQQTISRRRALALTGAAGVGAVAGCLGDDDDGNGDGNGNDSGNGDDVLEDFEGPEAEEVEQEYNENYEDWDQAVPSGAVNPFDGEYIFNPYHPNWNPGDGQETSYEYLAVYNTAEGDFIPRVAEGWEIDEDTLETEITLNDNYGWSNGDDITAADFATAIQMDAYMEMGIQEFIDPVDGISVEDDYTLVIRPRDDYQNLGKDFWESQFGELFLNVSEEHYGSFVEQFEDASSDDEIADVQSSVVSYEPEWNQTKFSGPFVFVEANEEYADQVPNPNHPATDDWEFYFRHGQYEDEEGLRAEEVTFQHQDPTLEDLPDIYDEAPVSYSGQTFALIFGPEDEYIRDYPEVRKALAFAIDYQTLLDSVSPATPVDTYSAGIDIGYIEHFVSDEALDAMTDYSVHDVDRAQELLEDVGFSLDDGTWYTPDDEEWSLEFPHGDWFDTYGEMINNNLQEFGIASEQYSDAMGTWQSEHGDTLDYDISVHLNYGMARQYHAHSDLEEEFFTADRAHVTGTEILSEEEEVPEVGNPDGDTFTINFQDKIDNIAVAESEEELIETTTEVAWAHNQLLPAAMVHPWSEHYWVDVGNWDFDLESDDWLTSNRITHYIIENGLNAE